MLLNGFIERRGETGIDFFLKIVKSDINSKMIYNKEFKDFIKFTLDGDINSKSKISLPKNYIYNELKKIIDSNSNQIIRDIKNIIDIEYLKSKNNIDLAILGGKNDDEKFNLQFKEKLLFNIYENLKKYE
jgi:hypothetical protein